MQTITQVITHVHTCMCPLLAFFFVWLLCGSSREGTAFLGKFLQNVLGHYKHIPKNAKPNTFAQVHLRHTWCSAFSTHLLHSSTKLTLKPLACVLFVCWFVGSLVCLFCLFCLLVRLCFGHSLFHSILNCFFGTGCVHGVSCSDTARCHHNARYEHDCGRLWASSRNRVRTILWTRR